MESSWAMTNEESPLFLDTTFYEFQECIYSEDWSQLRQQSAEEAAKRIYKIITPTARILENKDAADYLEALVAALQEDILVRHRAYGSVRWLWYLRRTPDELFKGKYNSTLGYDRLLAELLSWYQPVEQVSEISGSIRFRIDKSTARHVARFIGCVRLLSQLHVLYRRVGKGALLDTTTPIPHTTNCDTVEKAIRLYDQRQDESYTSSGSGLGLAPLGGNTWRVREEANEDENTLFILQRLVETARVPVSYPDSEGNVVEMKIDARYFPQTLNLNKIHNPFPTGCKTALPYLTSIAPFVQLLMMVPIFCSRLPWALGDIARQGYFFCRLSVFETLFEALTPAIKEQIKRLAPNIPCLQYPAWRRAIDATGPELWPLRSGGVLRQHGNVILIDIAATSHALLQRMELNRNPLLGNIRAHEFEIQCQAIINNSRWIPSQELAILRGRHLQLKGGQILTDVDAIGESGKTLLLVSCKSVIYDGDYDRGTYNVIRNNQTTIDTAVSKWAEVISLIQKNPIGQNFDFSSYCEIIGVVCTPFVVYSHEEKTLSLVKGSLRACVSESELREWLKED